MRYSFEIIDKIDTKKAVAICDICDEIDIDLCLYMMDAFWFSNAVGYFLDLTAEEIASLACDGYEVKNG